MSKKVSLVADLAVLYGEQELSEGERRQLLSVSSDICCLLYGEDEEWKSMAKDDGEDEEGEEREAEAREILDQLCVPCKGIVVAAMDADDPVTMYILSDWIAKVVSARKDALFIQLESVQVVEGDVQLQYGKERKSIMLLEADMDS